MVVFRVAVSTAGQRAGVWAGDGPCIPWLNNSALPSFPRWFWASAAPWQCERGRDAPAGKVAPGDASPLAGDVPCAAEVGPAPR